MALTLLVVVGLAGCRQLLIDPAPARASLSLSLAAPELTSADAAGAFDKADRVYIRVERAGSAPVEALEEFGPTGQETTVSLTLSMTEDQEPATITIELRSGTSVLFTAVHEVVLVQGATLPIEIDLAPVPSMVVIAGNETLEFDKVGGSVQLAATVAFATGDIYPGAQIVWSTSDARVAGVDSRGLVTIRGSGDATIEAAYNDLSDEVQIHVQQAVATVTIDPERGSLLVGETLALHAVLRDAANNVIAGQPVSWSAQGNAATVHPTSGLVTGVSPGTATITATADGKSGSAVVVVSQPSSDPFDGDWSGTGVSEDSLSVEVDVSIDQTGSTAKGSFGISFQGSGAEGGGGLEFDDGKIEGNTLLFTASDKEGEVEYVVGLALSEDGTRLQGGVGECYPDYYCPHTYSVTLTALGGAPVAAVVDGLLRHSGESRNPHARLHGQSP